MSFWSHTHKKHVKNKCNCYHESDSDEQWWAWRGGPSPCFWVRKQQNSKKGILICERVYQMVTDSTTNQFAVLILEISVSEPLRLDLWVSGLLFPFLLVLTLKVCLAGTLTGDDKQKFSKELKQFLLNKYIPYILQSILNTRSLRPSDFTLAFFNIFQYLLYFLSNCSQFSCFLLYKEEWAWKSLISKHPFDLSSELRKKMWMLTDVALGFKFFKFFNFNWGSIIYYLVMKRSQANNENAIFFPGNSCG